MEEREVTSASNIYRRRLCPGSANAEAGAIDESTEAADEGTLLHPFAINRKLSRVHLTDAQQRLLEFSDSNQNHVCATACEQFDIPLTGKTKEFVEYRSERLQLWGPDNEPLFTGESDHVFSWPACDAAAVTDFKLGFVPVPKAAHNYQLACYSVMWSDFLGIGHVLVAINQPRLKDGLSMAAYNAPGIAKARAELAAIYHASQEKDAPRIAGDEQCRFCKAKLFCPEWKRKYRPLTTKPEAQTVATLDGGELKEYYAACRAAASIHHRVMDEVTRRIEAGDADFEGWELSPNGSTRECTDVVGAYNILKDYFSGSGGFTGKDFTDCTSIRWKDLNELFKRLSGFAAKRAESTLNALLEPVLVWKQKKPSPQPKP